jgi:4-amino-4-deoxy-L-arabinose transferase-like glycosyltransferase
MPKQPQAAIIVCLLLLAFFFHLAVAWQDFPTLARNGFLYDDSFYAFKIAQNMAAGQGMTFDGIHSTNGFQPLYVLLLVPIFFFFGETLSLPIYFALTLLAIFSLLTTLLIYLICRRYVGRTASFIAALIWVFSPIVTKQSANGLETALTAFMIALCSYYYLEKIRSCIHPPLLRLILFGLILGLAVLSRIDTIFLVLVIFLDYLFLLRRRRSSSSSVLRSSLVPLGVLIVYGPWLVLCLIACGSPLQDSGAATRFLSLAYAPMFDFGSMSLGTEGPDLTFIWAHIQYSFSALKVAPPVHVIFRLIAKIGEYAGAQSGVRLVGNFLGFLLLLATSLLIFKWKRDPERRRRLEIGFLFLFCGLVFVSYSLYIFGAFFFLRYFYPLFMLSCILIAFIIQDLLDWLPQRSLSLRRFAIGAVVLYTGFFSYFSYSQAFRSHAIYPFYDIAKWVRAHTDKDDTVGIFQCGTVGYLVDRKVINLDGKVNRQALSALKNGCLEEYIEEESIDVIVDHATVIDIFLDEACRSKAISYTVIPHGAKERPSGWVALRFNPASEKDELWTGTGAASPASPSLGDIDR